MASRMKIRKDDTVKVISGKDRGKTGTVLRTDPERQRVYVEGANIQKRHQRPQHAAGHPARAADQGGVIEVEGPIHVSNVELLDPSTGEPTRVGIQRDGTAAQARRQALRDGDRLMPATAAKITPRLKERYQQEIAPALTERFGYANPMQVPKVEKITLNMGVGDAKQDSRALEAAQGQLAAIAGQRPNIRRSRKSIAEFKLREGCRSASR